MSIDKDNKFINSKIITGDVVAEAKQLGQEFGNNGLITKTKFLNFSNEYIAIGFRDGTITIIPPETSYHYSDCLLIVHHKSNYKSPIHSVNGDDDELTCIIRNKLARNKNQNLNWEELIPINVIKNSRTGVYCRTADVMVTMTDRYECMNAHPASVQNFHNECLSSEEGFNPMYDVSITIKLICNTGIQHRLYALINNRIIVINPKRSDILTDGLYITGLTQIETPVSNGIRTHDKYDVKEALTGKCPIQVFDTIIEAKEAIAERKNISAFEQKTARDHELLMADLKRQKEIVENENIKVKLEAAKQRAIEDELASRREKEFLEYKLKAEKEMQIIKDKAALDAAKIKSYGDIAKAVVVTATLGLTLYKLFSAKK